jgi:transposase
MFVRKKKNPSGVISIQVVYKRSGRYRVIKTIGSSSDASTVEALFEEGQKWIAGYQGQQDLFEQSGLDREESRITEYFLSNVESILINGTQLILDNVFKLVGFDKVSDDILKFLVIARLSQPMSKSATVDYLKSHFNEDYELHKIYRYLDKLYNHQQALIQEISIEHTRMILGGQIGLMFYDVTTLYFETDKTDELREPGFSKDGKHSQSQVVLGLLVSKEGYPLSYSLFNGSQYEGWTMVPLLEDFIQRFKLEDFVVVADSGLMNKTNLALLESGGYKYIIGARIKNETAQAKQWILSREKKEGAFYEHKKKDGTRLIIGYSEKRAKKDKYNREKGVARLQRAYKNGKITKEHVNKRGYNKFLDISKDITVDINQDKIKEDEQWDGLKGYITNTNLSAEEIYEQYSGLWVVEKAFRVTKGTLEVRPMFHFTPRRIEAHVCICFVAYKVYKEFERILKNSNIKLSVDKVLSIAKTVTTIKIKLPESGSTLEKVMLLTPQQKSIAPLFDQKFWKAIAVLDNGKTQKPT